MIRRRRLPPHLITDPAKMCEVLVGLPDVCVLGLVDAPVVDIHIETTTEYPQCPDCGGGAQLKDQRPVVLVDQPSFGRPNSVATGTP